MKIILHFVFLTHDNLVGTSVAAMVMESNPIVYVSGCLGVAVAPYAVIQQQKLTQCEALKQTNERMGEEVTQLKEENVRLQSTVQQLETSVVKYVDVDVFVNISEWIHRHDSRCLAHLKKPPRYATYP